MRSALHDEVAGVAQDRGAMVIHERMLRNAALDSFLRATEFGNKSQTWFPTGHKSVGSRYNGISIDPATLRVDLDDSSGSICLRIGPQFRASIELFYPIKPDLSYLTIELTVPTFLLPLSANDQEIIFHPTGIPVTAVVTEAITRADAIAASEISEEDLLRVEGSISYGSGTRLIESVLGQLQPISLKTLFPAIEFSGELQMFKVTGALVVVPESFTFIGNTGCPKGDATGGVAIIPQTPGVTKGNTKSWPIAANLPPPQRQRHVSTADGLVSTYLPKPALDVKFGKVTPAVTYTDHGNGFIGYDVSLSASIRRAAASIDPIGFGLRLALDFAIRGIAVATIDVPCIGRMDLAQVRLEMPENNGTATMEVALRFAVDSGGRLLVIAELTKADLGVGLCISTDVW